jgi:hypothetical protein
MLTIFSVAGENHFCSAVEQKAQKEIELNCGIRIDGCRKHRCHFLSMKVFFRQWVFYSRFFTSAVHSRFLDLGFIFSSANLCADRTS